MAVSQGHDAHLAFVTQAALGTPDTRTGFTDIISSTLKGVRDRVHSPNLGTRSQRIYTEMSSRSEGAIELLANFEGLDTLLYHAMGAKAAAQQGGTAAYLHTLTLADAPPSPGLSVEVVKGGIQAFLYEACKIASITFTQAAGDYLRITLNLVGRGETKVSATSPTFPSDLPIHQSQFAFTIDAGATTVNNFSLTIDNGLDANRPQLGNVLPKEIIASGKRMITGSFEIDFEDTTEYDNWVSNTAVALSATWTGAQIESPYNYSLNLACPAAKYEGTPPDVQEGPITVPFTFVALEQTRNAQDELEIQLINTATAIA